MIDATHDVKRRSWVESANGHPDFPIQNLPFGIYSKAGERPRGGVAVGDDIFDLKMASEAGLFSGEAKRAADAAGGQPCRRLLPAQRLVGARHPGLGVPAAGPLPRQVVRDFGQPLGGAA